jgi:hypothetical protein
MVLAAVACEFAALRKKDKVVRSIPLLDNIQSFVDFAP